jgi:catechol 2,3-dioxygenase-like lactoylglutathione lyase family enzyme
MNVFYNTIVFVKDIKKSRDFYENIIGLKVENDYQTIVFFDNHFVIHDGNNLFKTVYKRSKIWNPRKGRENLLIYFETDDVDKSYADISKHNIKVIHGIEEQAWGQRVFRFYDPDQHIIEIGEAMHLEYLKKEI